MEFPKVQLICINIHFLETMEMKSLKKNLALKITILHLLRDPMISKKVFGGNTGLHGLINGAMDVQTFITLKEGSLHCMSTLNDSLSLLKSVNDNFKSVYIII